MPSPTANTVQCVVLLCALLAGCDQKAQEMAILPDTGGPYMLIFAYRDGWGSRIVHTQTVSSRNACLSLGKNLEGKLQGIAPFNGNEWQCTPA